MDVFPGFWERIKLLAQQGHCLSIDRVRNEIFKNEDDLKGWCSAQLPEGFFRNTSDLIVEYSRVINWAYRSTQQYTPAAIAEFAQADVADAWLVAFALKYDVPIVTYERSQPNIKRKIKLPDVCLHFDLDFLMPIEMLRRLNQSF